MVAPTPPMQPGPRFEPPSSGKPREAQFVLQQYFVNSYPSRPRRASIPAQNLCSTPTERPVYTQWEAQLASEGDRPVYSIGAVARMLDIPAATL